MSRPSSWSATSWPTCVVTLSGPLAPGSDTPARIEHRGGGSGANVAAWLARAGARRASASAASATTPPGRGALAELAPRASSALVAVDAERPTGTCVVLVDPDGERSMLPDRGANAALAPAPLPEDAAHLHVAGYALLDPGARPAALPALAEARRLGCPVSVDPASRRAAGGGRGGGLPRVDRPGRPPPPQRRRGRRADRPGGPGAAARALAAHADEVVVTLGAEGALWSDGRTVEHVAAAPADAVDTTGAGDAFAAGLLAARTAGSRAGEALAAGAALAAQAVRRPGAR